MLGSPVLQLEAMRREDIDIIIYKIRIFHELKIVLLEG